jgi:hypothetical protein
MLDNNNFHILTQAESLKLGAEKIADRQQLFKLPPQEVQAIVNRIIDPQLWKPDFSSSLEFNSLSLTDDEPEN